MLHVYLWILFPVFWIFPWKLNTTTHCQIHYIDFCINKLTMLNALGTFLHNHFYVLCVNILQMYLTWVEIRMYYLHHMVCLLFHLDGFEKQHGIVKLESFWAGSKNWGISYLSVLQVHAVIFLVLACILLSMGNKPEQAGGSVRK